MKPRPIQFIVGAFWLLAVGIGLAVVVNYDTAPGRMGETPVAWPAQAPVAFDAARPTLVMFAHPRCPCTRASVNELNRLLAKCHDQMAVHVFFLKPEGQPDDWVKSDLWRSAADIPGVTLHEDVGGREAARFGAKTSGQVMLFDQRGRLLFQGGITAARGHVGDNAGAAQIRALLSGAKVEARRIPVFGCALQDDEEAPAVGVVVK
ncbi:MAG: hypothetical protein QM813_14730 [Verrucomicrobiota bacterium]